jgi:hypothetical protein
MTPTTELTLPQARNRADKSAAHARACKKPLDSCATCQATVQWFATLPLPMLSLVLEDHGSRRAL